MQQLETFRNETLHQAKLVGMAKGEQGQEDRKTLARWFERLDDLGSRFEGWLWAIAGNVLDTVREGNGSTIVRLIKIIEVEGKEDEKVRRGY
jgi:exocyst complex component 3